YQLIPIAMQLMFLLSPILYQKEALGALGWTADLNPLYRVLSNLRHALIQGELKMDQTLIVLFINLIGVLTSLWLLERKRRELPFLV
ncbi:phosphate ABC transporter permease, partial [Cyanobium sp. BA5m-21]|nr:phosphate ABC transporter permease [Cyanobium sp. BA5m-21]